MDYQETVKPRTLLSPKLDIYKVSSTTNTNTAVDPSFQDGFLQKSWFIKFMNYGLVYNMTYWILYQNS